MNRKFLLDAARQRRESSNVLRRQQAKALAQSKTRSTLFTNFAVALDRSIRGESVIPEVKDCVSQLLTETKVNVENIQVTREQPVLRWRDYLDPMYNTLRMFISKSKEQGDLKEGDKLWREFWLAVSTELQSQLNGLAAIAEVPSREMGRATRIVENEIGRN